MRRLSLLCLILLFTAASALAQPSRTLTRTFSLAADGAVSIHNHQGSIDVEAWDREDVRVEVRMVAEDEDQLEATNIRMDSSTDELVLATEYDEGGIDLGGFWDFFSDGSNERPDVHYIVRMPETARLRIDDHESDINVSGLASSIAVGTHDGAITINDIAGDVRVESHDGSMEISNIGGALDIETHEADVTLRNIQGPVDVEGHEPQIRATRIGGGLGIDAHDPTLRLDDVQGRVVIDTHEGNVEIDGLDGSIELDTHDADVTVAFRNLTGESSFSSHDSRMEIIFPQRQGFDLDFEFDDDDAELTTDMSLDAVRRTESSLRGSVSDGGPTVHLETHDGTFILAYR